MLLEYADRGSLEQAIHARRFYKRTDATLDLVSRTARCSPCLLHRPDADPELSRLSCKGLHAPLQCAP
jgi:hypothetical protein